MADAPPRGYGPRGGRGRYRRVVEVYGTTTVARSSAIAFGWCTKYEIRRTTPELNQEPLERPWQPCREHQQHG